MIRLSISILTLFKCLFLTGGVLTYNSQYENEYSTHIRPQTSYLHGSNGYKFNNNGNYVEFKLGSTNSLNRNKFSNPNKYVIPNNNFNTKNHGTNGSVQKAIRTKFTINHPIRQPSLSSSSSSAQQLKHPVLFSPSKPLSNIAYQSDFKPINHHVKFENIDVSNNRGLIRPQYKQQYSQQDDTFLPIDTKFKTDLAISNYKIQVGDDVKAQPKESISFNQYQNAIYSKRIDGNLNSDQVDVASTGQIEMYKEDLKKYQQILSDAKFKPTADNIDEYHQFLKATEDEKVEEENLNELIRRRPPPPKSTFQSQYESQPLIENYQFSSQRHGNAAQLFGNVETDYSPNRPIKFHSSKYGTISPVKRSPQIRIKYVE